MNKILQVGVKVILTTHDKHMFLGITRNESKKLLIDESYDIPGGRLDIGESPLEGLRRELLEEIGYTLINAPILLDAQNIINNEEKQIIRLTYISHENISLDKIIIGDEHCSAKILPLEESSHFHPLLNKAINLYLNK